MNAVEIEAPVSDLASAEYNAAEFSFQFWPPSLLPETKH
jgi:hypothetical protein